MPSSSTSDRILDAALASFASRGYEATSLDTVAKSLELTKQSILYWFPSKDALLEAVIARSADDLSAALETALQGRAKAGTRVEAVVRSVFRLAARQPELLGLLREVGRLGPPAATQMTLALDPLVERASAFLEAEMDAGTMRRHDPRLLLLAIYSTVIGMITEVEVLRALGEEPTARSLVRRRADVLQLLRSALLVERVEPVDPVDPVETAGELGRRRGRSREPSASARAATYRLARSASHSVGFGIFFLAGALGV